MFVQPVFIDYLNDVEHVSSISRPEIEATQQGYVMSEKAKMRAMKGLLAKSPTLKAPMGVHVGELQELWQFPSDHLPIAMELGSTRFASWNVLDAAYMDWVIEKDSQGLARSLIGDEHIYLDGSNLTVRDLHTARLVQEMLEHPTHPRDIIALQECSKDFLKHLQSELSSDYQIVSHGGEAFVLSLKKFELIDAQGISNLFSMTPKRTIQKIAIRDLKTQEVYHLVNGHLPGEPTHPARFEFTSYLADLQKQYPNDKIIAMGDMNFNELEMESALQKACGRQKLDQWQILSPYCTNISPFAFDSKAIDHFFVYNPSGFLRENQRPKAEYNPDHIMSELKRHVLLLQQPQEDRTSMNYPI